METRHVNYKSDFVLRETFRNGSGKVVALPDVDFTLRYWVKAGRVYEASRRGGVFTNCVADGDGLLVMFKDHNLGEGELRHELHLALDNELFDDGIQNVYYPESLHLWLWDKIGDTEGVINSDCVAAYTRGNAFTFEDFTAAQIALLQQPALEAAEQADAATDAAQEATRQAIASKEQADAAAAAASEAASNANTSKEQADAAAAAASEAASNANASKEQADAATAAALAAKRNADAATEQAGNATEQARQAAESAGVAAQNMEATNTEAQEIIERARLVVVGVPTVMDVNAPAEITIGNTVKRYVRAVLKPVGVLQNVLFLTGNGEVVDVLPDGEVVANSEGTATVHVIPTQRTELYKSIKITAVKPRMRMAGGGLRLDKDGNIRLT